MENQLMILSESLDKKIQVLLDIQAYNERQEEAFSKGVPDLSSFDAAVEQKELLIQRLEKLDEGFETFYGKLSKELQENRALYAAQIQVLQEKIARVTELGVSIQAQEARNKKLIEEYFARERAGIRKGRVGSKVAYDYYRSMSGSGMGQSRFLDQKN